MKHLTAMNELSLEDIHELIEEARELKKGNSIPSSPESLLPICFLNRAQERASASKWLKRNSA